VHAGTQKQESQNTNGNTGNINSGRHALESFEVIDTIRFIAMCSITDHLILPVVFLFSLKIFCLNSLLTIPINGKKIHLLE